MHTQNDYETDQYYRWDMLNYLIKLYNYSSYLEVGCAAGYNFNKINCEYKLCVDPEKKFDGLTHNMTSDEFFEQNTRTFDLIFIDGLHESNQVKKDISNSLNILNPKGTIMMHDCLPLTYEEQTPERTQWNWTGDVWKAFAHYRQDEKLTMFTVDTDKGLGIIKKGRQEVYNLPEDLNWNHYMSPIGFDIMLPHSIVETWKSLDEIKSKGL